MSATEPRQWSGKPVFDTEKGQAPKHNDKASGIGETLAVAQTPYQLFCCTIIAKFLDKKQHLWLIDKATKSYWDNCRKSGLWASVHYAERSSGDIWNSGWLAKMRRGINLLKSKRRIDHFYRQHPIGTVFTGSDNHDLTAYLVKAGAKRGARIILFEEGSTVHFSPFRIRAPTWKAFARKLACIPNPAGFTIGWSPDIHTVVLSNAATAHADVLGNRVVCEWPKGPFPAEAVDAFMGIGEYPNVPRGVDVVYLGSPMHEVGWMSYEDEKTFVNSIASTANAWIKPHHFDTPGKYEFCEAAKLLPRELWSIPAEVLFHKMRPAVTVSMFSSAGINYSTRYGKAAVFILPPRTPPDVKPLLERYIDQGYPIWIAENPSDVAQLIRKLINKDRSQPSSNNSQEWRRSVDAIFKTSLDSKR